MNDTGIDEVDDEAKDDIEMTRKAFNVINANNRSVPREISLPFDVIGVNFRYAKKGTTNHRTNLCNGCARDFINRCLEQSAFKILGCLQSGSREGDRLHVLQFPRVNLPMEGLPNTPATRDKTGIARLGIFEVVIKLLHGF